MDYAFDYAVDPINTGLFDIAAETVPTVPRLGNGAEYAKICIWPMFIGVKTSGAKPGAGTVLAHWGLCRRLCRRPNT